MSYINATINTTRGNKVKFLSMEGNPRQYWVYLNGELMLHNASVSINDGEIMMIVGTAKDGVRVEKWLEFEGNELTSSL
jgi:hypothetical protein